jgi:hypothetical protein
MTVAPSNATCLSLYFSRHALERMFQRGIPPEAIQTLLTEGEIIATYADDQPYPSELILGWHANKPVHAVIARDAQTEICQVITVYQPDPLLWDATFKLRNKS